MRPIGYCCGMIFGVLALFIPRGEGRALESIRDPQLCRSVLAEMQRTEAFVPVEIYTVSSLCGFHVTFLEPKQHRFLGICPATGEPGYAVAPQDLLLASEVAAVRHPNYQDDAPRRERARSCDKGEALLAISSPLQSSMKEKVRAAVGEQVARYRVLRATSQYVRGSDLPAEMEEIVEWFVNTVAALDMDVAREWETRRERIRNIGVEYAVDIPTDTYFLLIYRNYRDRGRKPPSLFRVEHRLRTPTPDGNFFETQVWVHNCMHGTKECWFKQ